MNVPLRFDVLDAFFRWWMVQYPSGLPLCLHDCVSFAGENAGLVLYRQDAFQVQLWICRPDSEIPDHSHPNIDTYQVYLGGEVYLRHNGVAVIEPAAVREAAGGVSSHNGRYIRVKPGETHGAKIGPLGGAFVVVQHFLDGMPRSTEMDWEGPALDENHRLALELQRGDPDDKATVQQ